jgi:hypothetical protein
MASSTFQDPTLQRDLFERVLHNQTTSPTRTMTATMTAH